MFYTIDQVRSVHLEISSLCNANCPLCPRNHFGYTYNDGYTEHSMTLIEAQKIFSPEFIAQLNSILINGNFGDIVMAPEATNIVEYFRQHNQRAHIEISTNGAARNSEFWRRLAKLNCHIDFRIDGLEDTHSMYRQNTLYSTVINNAQTFIQAGGQATWTMLIFEHNKHQVEQAQSRAQSMGMIFKAQPTARDTGPVFNAQGEFRFVMNPSRWQTHTELKPLLDFRTQSRMPISPEQRAKTGPIDCQAIRGREIYVSSIGDIYPCCYTGFEPKTYGHGCYQQPINEQLKELVQENNAIEYGLAHAIKWFNSLSDRWSHSTIEQGRLIVCSDVCSQ